MTTEEYVILSPREAEVPSSISFIQSSYENLKKRLIQVGTSTSLFFFLLLHVAQLITGITLFQSCSNDRYTPSYFIVAGTIGAIVKIYHFVTVNEQSRIETKRRLILVLFYCSELAWLFLGTYYYSFGEHHHGCSSTSYASANWLILTEYVCLILCSVIFTWSLSIIFVLVYFKNRTVQNLAKHMNLNL